MRRDVRTLLQQMLQHAVRLQAFIADRSLTQFTNDQLLIDAVSMNFVVIGEALSNVKKLDRPTAERVSEWNRIIGFRNQLVHGYAEIEDEITWTIIQDKVPVLVRAGRIFVRRLLLPLPLYTTGEGGGEGERRTARVPQDFPSP